MRPGERRIEKEVSLVKGAQGARRLRGLRAVLPQHLTSQDTCSLALAGLRTCVTLVTLDTRAEKT